MRWTYPSGTAALHLLVKIYGENGRLSSYEVRK